MRSLSSSTPLKPYPLYISSPLIQITSPHMVFQVIKCCTARLKWLSRTMVIPTTFSSLLHEQNRSLVAVDLHHPQRGFTAASDIIHRPTCWLTPATTTTTRNLTNPLKCNWKFDTRRWLNGPQVRLIPCYRSRRPPPPSDHHHR